MILIVLINVLLRGWLNNTYLYCISFHNSNPDHVSRIITQELLNKRTLNMKAC